MVTHHFYITHDNSNESVCVYFTTSVEHPNDKGSKNILPFIRILAWSKNKQTFHYPEIKSSFFAFYMPGCI